MSLDGNIYLRAAFFCERLLKEVNGTPTPVRIMDLIESTLPRDFPSVPALFVDAEVVFFLGLSSYDFEGRKEITVNIIKPDGSLFAKVGWSATFQPKHTFHLDVPMRLDTRCEGMYWGDVFLDGVLLTKVPFEIRHVRQSPRGSDETNSELSPSEIQNPTGS